MFAWMKYKLRESLLLSRIVIAILGSPADHLAIHNSAVSKKHITDGFLSELAGKYYSQDISLVYPAPQTGLVQLSALFLAFIVFIVPVIWMRRVIVVVLKRSRPSLRSVLVFCDAHLSGFVLCLALKDLDVATATLQHGLYRSDDKGSVMALSNFVADRIFLWDEITRAEFIDFGVESSRIEITGSYGFGFLKHRRCIPVDKHLIYLCPSYHNRSVEYFIRLHNHIPSTFVVQYSLHPILQTKFQLLNSRPLNVATPRPMVAICGDSAVIMDSLALGIPVITVGERKLASVHLSLDQPQPSEEDWAEFIREARNNLDEDRRRFGFWLITDSSIYSNDREASA